MMYELTVGLRYLKSRRRQTFISLITVISIGGVTVGVMVLIIVLAVMSGFETTLKEKILGMNSHVWVLPQMTRYIEDYEQVAAQVRAMPHVTLVSPFTTHEVMLMAEGRVAGTILRGIDPAQKDLMADLRHYFRGEDLQQLLLPAPSPAQSPAAAGRGSAAAAWYRARARIGPHALSLSRADGDGELSAWGPDPGWHSSQYAPLYGHGHVRDWHV